ncbi:MAG: GNAT family N-acetyltransferase [Verrucomicrobiota bacterium]
MMKRNRGLQSAGELRGPKRKQLGTEPLRLSLDVRFRLCERRDLPLLEWEGLYRDARRIIASTFRMQARGAKAMLIAEINDMPVGQVWLDFATYRKERMAFLWSMRVVPWFQGLGIGFRLLQEAERMAAKRNCMAIQLTVDEGNLRAGTFYERYGFAVVGKITEYEPYTTKAGRRVRLRRPRFVMRKDVGCLSDG